MAFRRLRRFAGAALAPLSSGGKAMRNLLAFTAAAALTIAGLGWYLGWYKIHATPAANGHRNVNIDIDIDTAKIGDDINRAEKRILDHASDQAQQTKDKTDKRVENPLTDAANFVPGR
jgi:hypothetical protein